MTTRRHAVWRGAHRCVSAVVTSSFVVLCAIGSAPLAHGSVTAPTAKATITFDVRTGKVLAAEHDRRPLRVASTFKVLTALVARANLDLDETIPITKRAEAVPPLKLTMEPGTRWGVNGLMHAMLIASINDAAVALAEAAGGGSLTGFERALDAEARRLGLRDHPVLHDPAGLDDESSVSGGNLISARDLAIATRAFLSDPYLAGIVRLPSYRFAGGDGKPHVVYNHNAFLQTYPDAIGVKTGYTERSGHSLIAAATRNGRTLAVVVIGSDDPVGEATGALDAAFSGVAEGTGETLGVIGVAPVAVAGVDARVPSSFRAVVPPRGSATRSGPLVLLFATAVVMVLVAARVLRRDRPPRPVGRRSSGSPP